MLSQIESDAGLKQVYDFVQESQKNHNNDPSHDMAHFIRVARMALAFRTEESFINIPERNVIAAALLHDVVNLPKNHPDAKKASEESAELARDILPGYGFHKDDIHDISDAVLNHSFSRGQIPETNLGKIIQDADRIESLGILGIIRTISVGTQMGGLFFDSVDPWAHKRDLNDQSFMIDHFFKKLFKLPKTLNTKAAKNLAQKRVETMEVFLSNLGEEIYHPYLISKIA